MKVSLDNLRTSVTEFLSPDKPNFPANADGTVDIDQIKSVLYNCGFLDDDPRFKILFNGLKKSKRLTPESFLSLIADNHHSEIIEKAFHGSLVVPDFESFCDALEGIYDHVSSNNPPEAGHVASYIPQLAKVDPNLFAVSVCTIDGQRFSIGDFSHPFTAQSCVKPFLYCLALEEHGHDKVHAHVGREPSGVAFNSLCLNSKNVPHNPMINAGAIMCCSLIESAKTDLSEKFDKLNNFLTEMSAGFRWGFSNSVYQSEKATADRNNCLAYMMKGSNAFAPNATNLADTLDLYFQSCSIETDCNRMAMAGATLANNGVCPFTDKQVLDPETCRSCISLMYSCGMYDYSGEWAFSIGVPAKSGVSGVIYAVIPDFGCITVFSPPLDNIGNSMRGIAFFRQLIQDFSLHNFDSRRNEHRKTDPRQSNKTITQSAGVTALYCAAQGEISELYRLLRSGIVSPDTKDYDDRSLLHLAASNGHEHIVKLLLKYSVNIDAVDRWNGTPKSDAIKYKHENIVKLLSDATKRSSSVKPVSKSKAAPPSPISSRSVLTNLNIQAKQPGSPLPSIKK
jgi:glutaminase